MGFFSDIVASVNIKRFFEEYGRVQYNLLCYLSYLGPLKDKIVSCRFDPIEERYKVEELIEYEPLAKCRENLVASEKDLAVAYEKVSDAFPDLSVEGYVNLVDTRLQQTLEEASAQVRRYDEQAP